MDELRTRFIASRDGKRLRTASWESAPGVARRGVCVILDGQTEFLEKYGEVVQELAARGFAGAALDWRGQGGSDRTLSNPLKAHVGDFCEYDWDLQSFMNDVVAPMSDAPPLALGHSMGAHILLRALNANPRSFASAAMTAPMIRTDTSGFPAWLVRLICSTYNLAGLTDEFVWGMRDRDPLHTKFEDNRVTSDRVRFARAQTLLAGQTQIRLAGPTWGWFEAALRSMTAMQAPGFAEAIATPCLVFGAGRDRIVDTAAVRAFARRLPNGAYVELADAEHEIMMENDSIRARFWQAFDEFVGRYA
ncbi:MAG TPA: alpha/beta hydrolase [Rhizomicrobium sp.]|nr:alpha/beta hydrolase [Rhizomicrobium sp.]